MPDSWPQAISVADAKSAVNALLVEIEDRLEIIGKVVRRLE